METRIEKKETTFRGNVLYMVVPCYNEEAVLPETVKRLSKKLEDMIARKKINERSRILFVNDGSKDGTWKLITKYSIFRETGDIRTRFWPALCMQRIMRM